MNLFTKLLKHSWMASLALLTLLMGCAPKQQDESLFQGYIEGEYVYVAAPVSGTLTSLLVKRGDTVTTNQPLFELEHAAESAAVAEAQQRLAQATARRDNLLKGKRPTELAAMEARLAQSRTTLSLAETDLKRLTNLHQNNSGAVSQEQLDQARTQRDSSIAAIKALEAELATARLGAREDEIKAAELEISALKAALEKVRWPLEQKNQSSPAAGVIHDTLYRQGEFVNAGSPIISLLPPANIKVRFFVPQAMLAQFTPGKMVQVSFDGASKPLSATVSYISTQAEFTPPVIYSQQTRSKLVFMVEAIFPSTETATLRPGQPVDVKLD